MKNIFNSFKKFKSNDILTIDKVDFENKSINEIVEEIHESFYTEVDKLLAQAKIANSLDTDKQNLIDKYEKLKSFGFRSNPEMKAAESEIHRLNQLKNDNENKNQLIKAIDYFSNKYPNYKFITEDSVKKICEKYNLIYGNVNNYIGNVPDENLKHIENFKIDEVDNCFFHREYGMDRYINKSKYDKYINDHSVQWNNSRRTEVYTCSLEIAAPLKDFEQNRNYEVKDFKLSKIEIPDPVVLQPVIFDNQKHYLIVTAWGLEASDELVVNQRFN